MSKPIRVLIVEDSENDALLLVRELRRHGFEPVFERVDTAPAMTAALRADQWDLVISDYQMPHFSGNEAIAVLRQSGLDLPFIIVSGAIGEDVAVTAMKAGAHDYVMKNNLKRLGTAIERELREVEIRRDRRQAEERLRYLAQYDSLTGLPNRNLFYERVEQAIAAKHGGIESFAVLLIDLDDFKDINGTLGHHNGDGLLQQVGARLLGALQENSLVARMGGDEFAVLLLDADERSARQTADRLLKTLLGSFMIGELALYARASIGIAVFPDHGEDLSTLMSHADIAMHFAKERRDGSAVYSETYDRHRPERLTLMTDLHYAIDNEQLFLAYQPKVRITSGEVIGVEALARWRHPKLDVIPPDQFIPMAEHTGFIKPLTLWALDAALSQAGYWREQGIDLTVAVNISTRTLHDMDLPDVITDLCKKHRVPRSWLELEITESAIMADAARALKILSRIRELGIALSIDDFGTGYSSFAQLQKLPVNALKIDRSFIRQIVADNGAPIVRAIVGLAHDLGLQVIAEGVESREIWNRLLALDCDAAQGYYVSRPLAAPEITQWLREPWWGTERLDSVVTALEL